MVMTESVYLFQHWPVFVDVSEIFILVPALLGLKGNLEMTLASRLSTQVSSPLQFNINVIFELPFNQHVFFFFFDCFIPLEQ